MLKSMTMAGIPFADNSAAAPFDNNLQKVNNDEVVNYFVELCNRYYGSKPVATEYVDLFDDTLQNTSVIGSINVPIVFRVEMDDDRLIDLKLANNPTRVIKTRVTLKFQGDFEPVIQNDTETNFL